MQKVKVWDLFVRLFHWGLALLVLASFLTSDEDALVPVHVSVGLAVVALVLARVVWGVLGPRHARFRTFVRGPRDVVAYARAMLRGRPPAHASHNPLGGAMVVALLVVLAALAATGAIIRAGPEFAGPLAGILTKHGAKAVEEVHEALSAALVALIVLHVAGALVSSLLERQNLVLGMLTGWKRAPAEAVAAGVPRRAWVRSLAGATALAIGVAAAFGLALLIGFPGRGHAASHAASPVAEAPLLP